MTPTCAWKTSSKRAIACSRTSRVWISPASTTILKTQDAVIRVFEIIGEAVKSLPDEWTHAEPDIPWRQIAGFRDVLAHAYFAVNSSVVWTAAVEKTPLIRHACLRLLRK